MTGTTLDYNQHCKIEFGAYAEAHEEPTPMDNMQTRAEPSICLGPVGNLQGSYKFLNLRTGTKIKRRKWTELPRPRNIIDTG